MRLSRSSTVSSGRVLWVWIRMFVPCANHLVKRPGRTMGGREEGRGGRCLIDESRPAR